MAVTEEERKRQADALYERYGKPLEQEHEGQYVAISPEGKILLGSTMLDVLRDARASFGPGNFIFKVRTRAVGRWR